MVRPRDLVQRGIPRSVLQRLVKRGLAVRVGRGLYALAQDEPGEHRGLVEATRRVPRGVICLLSALSLRGITTQQPHEVWLAIEGKARSPQVDTPPLRVVRMSGAAFSEGVESHIIDGVTVQVFSVAKTVADLFKFRSKVGLDVALEALRQVLDERLVSIDELWSMARVCRVTNVMRPYLESLA